MRSGSAKCPRTPAGAPSLLGVLGLAGPLIILFIALPASAAKIYYTAPSTGSDSGFCSGTIAIRETLTTYLYGQRVTGGGFARADSHRVVPARADSFTVPWAGNFYITARNSKGESCAEGPPLYFPPSDPTDVPAEATDDPYGYQLFDVRGRLVAQGHWRDWASGLRPDDVASGVYFLRPTFKFRGYGRALKVTIIR